MVPGRENEKSKQEVLFCSLQKHTQTLGTQRLPGVRTNIDGGLSADDLRRERRQRRNVLPREQLM